jgi:hypothetical protein
MARPGHSRDHHAVFAAADAGCRRLDTEAGVAQIEATPPATALTLVIQRTAPAADSTLLPVAALGAHMCYDASVGFLDQALQHAVYHT